MKITGNSTIRAISLLIAVLIMGFTPVLSQESQDIHESLRLALQADDMEQVCALIEKGSLYIAKHASGEQALRYLAFRGRPDMMEELLEDGCDPDARAKRGDLEGWTPLTLALFYEQTACAAVLLDHGADPEEPVKGGEWKNWTPLMMAAGTGDNRILERLLQLGADPDDRTREERATALMMAAGGGHSECVQKLLEAGADLEKEDRNDWTALFYAAKAGSLPCIRLLVEAGADVNAKDSDMVSLMIYATGSVTELRKDPDPPADLEEILPYLRKQGAR